MSEPFRLYEDARREMYVAMEAAGGSGGESSPARAGFTLALRGFDRFLAEAARGRGMYRELEKKAVKMRATCLARGGVGEPLVALHKTAVHHVSAAAPAALKARNNGIVHDRRNTAIVPKHQTPAKPAAAPAAASSPAAPLSDSRRSMPCIPMQPPPLTQQNRVAPTHPPKHASSGSL